MNILLTIIAFVVIFSLLILVHEWGHFIMAKRAGILVEEFGFGLPPRIWGKKKGETLYSINWIPFGGFVRMYGENFADPKMLRSKRSFAAKSIRARVKVVVAGVVMNFLLAWILIFVGFSAGMQPLLAPDDVLGAISDGRIVLDSGLIVESVAEGSLASQVGFKPGDKIYAINSETVNDYNLEAVSKNPAATYSVWRDDKIYNYQITEEQLSDFANASGGQAEGGEGASAGDSTEESAGASTGGSAGDSTEESAGDSTEESAGESTGNLGLTFYDFAQFPRVKIFNLENYTTAYKAGLRSGDTIITVNGQQIFNVQQYERLVRGINTLEYEVYRDGKIENFLVERSNAMQVVVSKVIPDGPAGKAGLKEEDKIISVNGKEITDAPMLIQFTEEHKDEKLAYLIERDGQRIFYEIQPEAGRIGVYLSELLNYGADQGMALYNIDLMSSVTEIKDEKYPWYQAIYKGFGETLRLSKLTAFMFTDFIGSLLREGQVPDSVAGPVGIAQMTHVFVQEGFIPLIRFVAILSLSLAVINILPFPALDGGRLLFLIIEFVVGRRINQRWESLVHAFGYFLILLLIVAVTYSDVVRLIAR